MEVLFEHSENSKILDQVNSFFDHVDILGEQLWSLGGSECTIILTKKNKVAEIMQLHASWYSGLLLMLCYCKSIVRVHTDNISSWC